MVVDLRAKSLVHGADGLGFLHAAVVWVFCWRDVSVAVDLAVIVDFVVEIVPELIEETGGYQSRGCRVDAWFVLHSQLHG